MKRAAVPIGVAAACVLFAVFVTWPQARYFTTQAASHQDSYFSMWRLAWVAHALSSQPLDLFNGNIFYPVPATLMFSDAMLLQGLIAAPLFWIGLSPIVVYNLLLAVGFAGSGLGMFVLTKHLVGTPGPALVAAAVFTMAPYRIEHFMHLELQWAMWVPLTFWAVHRAVEDPSLRAGILAGVFLWLQIISCVYYGVFLAMALLVFVPLVLATARQTVRRTASGVAATAITATTLTLPYAWLYLRAARGVGPRAPEEVLRYSATPISYLASPPQNLLWGWTAAWGGAELNLYPGVVAATLAVLAFCRRPRGAVFAYAAILVVAVELSFGANGYLYPWIAERVAVLDGLRAPSRFSIIAVAAMSVLAAFGAEVVRSHFKHTRTRTRVAVVALLIGLLGIDDANTGMYISPVAHQPYDVYEMMRWAGPGVVVELPMPRADALPGDEPLYAFWSHTHWQPLVNGYSGYYPPEYIRTLEAMSAFPDDRSIGRLQDLGVRYIVIHHAFYENTQLTALLLALAARTDVRRYGTFRDPLGNAELFVVER